MFGKLRHPLRVLTGTILAAFADVIFRTASSSVSTFFSRTYSPMARGNVPKFRGCGLPRRIAPSVA